MIAYATERFDDCIEEAKPTLMLHWRELALYQDAIPLEPDYDAYSRFCAAGAMKVFTARKDGVLVGYANFIIAPHHLHYRHRWANNDIIYVHPDHRNGRVGVGLIRYVEKALREEGPIVINIETKEHSPDLASLLTLMGYDGVSRGFSKRLG